MKLDFAKLGGALLAAGPVLMNAVSNKAVWWSGFLFTVIGPVLLAVKRK